MAVGDYSYNVSVNGRQLQDATVVSYASPHNWTYNVQITSDSYATTTHDCYLEPNDLELRLDKFALAGTCPKCDRVITLPFSPSAEFKKRLLQGIESDDIERLVPMRSTLQNEIDYLQSQLAVVEEFIRAMGTDLQGSCLELE